MYFMFKADLIFRCRPVIFHHVGVNQLVVGSPAANCLLVMLSQGNIPAECSFSSQFILPAKNDLSVSLTSFKY